MILDSIIGKEIWIIGEDESIHDEHAGIFGTCEAAAEGFLLLRLEGHEQPTVFYNLRYVRSIELAVDESQGEARRFTLLHLDKARKDDDG